MFRGRCFTIALLASLAGSFNLGQARGATDGVDVKPLEVARWKALPDLPGPKGQAGVYAGVIGDTLVVAGGSNFPQAPPWRGGTKAYTAAISLLDLGGGSDSRWKNVPVGLPHPAAYGVTILVRDGLLLIGGCGADRCFDTVYKLQLEGEGNPTLQPMPVLPKPLAYASGAIAGDKVFVAGGQDLVETPASTRFCFMLDLSPNSMAKPAWIQLPPLPQPARTLPDCAAVADGGNVSFYVFSGRCVAPGVATVPLKDAYRYDTSTGQWTALPPVPQCIMAGAAMADDHGGIILLGGDSGEIFMQLEAMRSQLASTTAPSTLAELNKANIQLLESHPGFLKSVLRYDIRSQRYESFGSMPIPAPVTTTAVRWRSSIILPGGEIRPGIRSAKVWRYDRE